MCSYQQPCRNIALLLRGKCKWHSFITPLATWQYRFAWTIWCASKLREARERPWLDFIPIDEDNQSQGQVVNWRHFISIAKTVRYKGIRSNRNFSFDLVIEMVLATTSFRAAHCEHLPSLPGLIANVFNVWCHTHDTWSAHILLHCKLIKCTIYCVAHMLSILSSLLLRFCGILLAGIAKVRAKGNGVFTHCQHAVDLNGLDDFEIRTGHWTSNIIPKHVGCTVYTLPAHTYISASLENSQIRPTQNSSKCPFPERKCNECVCAAAATGTGADANRQIKSQKYRMNRGIHVIRWEF